MGDAKLKPAPAIPNAVQQMMLLRVLENIWKEGAITTITIPMAETVPAINQQINK